MLQQNLERICRYGGTYTALGLMLGLAGCGTHQVSPTASTGGTTTANANTVASGPVMGYVWDQTAGALRPVLGLPGAAYFGAPVFADGGFTGAASCARKAYALLTGSSGAILLASLPSGQPAQLVEQLSARQQIAFSPTCSTAVVYAADASAVLLLQGLPSAPSVKTLQLSSSRPVAGAAVSDSGAILIGTGQASGSVSVDGFGSDGTPVPAIASLSSFGGLAFLPSSESALIADAGKNVVWLQKSLATGATLTQIVSASDGIAQPLAIAPSADGRWALILNGGPASSVLRIDLAKKAPPEKVRCSCSPSELVPMSGNLVFRLNELGAGPLWAFDGDMSNSRVIFIPEVKHANPTGAAQ